MFALLLNFLWEVLQAPLFEGMAAAPHSAVISACLQATLGDAVIMLLAHAGVTAVTRRRRWVFVRLGVRRPGSPRWGSRSQQ